MQTFKKHTNFHAFILFSSFSGLTDTDVAAYFSTIPDNVLDVFFDFSKGQLTSDGAVDVIKYIQKKNIRIVQLNLDDNQIDDSFFGIIPNIAGNKSNSQDYPGKLIFYQKSKIEYPVLNNLIYRLSLANNKITDSGLTTIQSYQSYFYLDELNLSRNKGITRRALYKLKKLHSVFYYIIFQSSQDNKHKFIKSGLTDTNVSSYLSELPNNIAEVTLENSLSHGTLTSDGALQVIQKIREKNIEDVKLILDENRIDDTFFEKVTSYVASSYQNFKCEYDHQLSGPLTNGMFFRRGVKEPKNGTVHIYSLSLAKNLVTDVGVTSLQIASHMSSIEEIDLSGNKRITDKSVQGLATMVMRHQTNIKVAETGISPKIYIEKMFIISPFEKVKFANGDIKFSNQGLSDNEVASILNIISSFTECNTSKIDLSNNEITFKGAIAIFQFMKTKDIFQSINLSGNKIGDACIPTFIDMLSSTKQLREIYFGSTTGGNLISDNGIKHLESIKPGCINLASFSFSQNMLITDKSEPIFANLLKQQSISHLGLWKTGMSAAVSYKIMDGCYSQNGSLNQEFLNNKYANVSSNEDFLQDIHTLNKLIGFYSTDANNLLDKHEVLKDKSVPDVENNCDKLENNIKNLDEIDKGIKTKSTDINIIEYGKQRDSMRKQFIEEMKDMLSLIEKFTVTLEQEIQAIKINESKIFEIYTGIEKELDRVKIIDAILSKTNETNSNTLFSPDENDASSTSSPLLNSIKTCLSTIYQPFSQLTYHLRCTWGPIQKILNETKMKIEHAISKKEGNDAWLKANSDRISKLVEHMKIQENIQRRREVVASVEEEIKKKQMLIDEEESKIYEARAKLAKNRTSGPKTLILDLEQQAAIHTQNLQRFKKEHADLLKEQEKECYDSETNELLFPDLIPIILDNSNADANAQKESVEVSLQSYASSSSNEPDQPIFHIPQAFKIRPRSYQIVDLVGNGGFSEVYKVRKVSDGPKDDFYAFKQFKIISLSDKESISIANEVEILTSINHGNIVSIKGLIGDPQSVDASGKLLGVGLMMEFCQNLSLRNVLDKQPNLELSRIYKILSGVSLGLGYLHSLEPNPIIHGDIKSDNILIDSNWTAKLCDFGISKAISTITATRKATSWAGTLNYMAPEVHDEEEPEPSSDVYSFGCLIFESLSGERPWQGLKPNIIMKKICMNKESMDYSKIRGDAPHKLSALMQKCLSYDKQHRPRIQEVNADLETLLDPVIISNLDKSSQEFKAIETIFFPSSTNQQGSLNQNTFVVESIEKVQNDYTENIYASELRNVQRELGSSGSANERLLFHGTKRNDPCMVAKHRHGLMKDYSADGFYGRGLYFAELARYSHNGYVFRVPNTNQYKMLVCSVICGISNEKGASEDRTASHKTLAAKGCHSIHAGPHSAGYDSSCMYVIYKDSQATPRYIITYRNR